MTIKQLSGLNGNPKKSPPLHKVEENSIKEISEAYSALDWAQSFGLLSNCTGKRTAVSGQRCSRCRGPFVSRGCGEK